MIIRQLETSDYDEAVDLKISCWDEELAGCAPNRRIKADELSFITHWASAAAENNDIRLVYGAFEDTRLLGFAGASIAEPTDAMNGIELNYLFVHQGQRGRGLALMLIDRLLSEFSGRGFDTVVAYNHHYAPSNSFYRKLGAKVARQDIQGMPLDQLVVDVFILDFRLLQQQINAYLMAKALRAAAQQD